MSDVSGELERATSVEQVNQVLRTAARRALRAHGATVVLLDGEQCYYADEDSMSPLWKGQRFPAASCISGWAMLHRETVVIPDILVDERIPQAAYRPTFVRSLLMAPILHPDAIGAIGAYWAVGHLATPAEVAALEALAAQAGAAFDRFPEGIPARGIFG
ncbi:GAF domain-containing protein [Saccharothrix syringae]|uniref:GAF domain-containing protein n=1 Tax=Saccharothrix syringae TaxID=103733 RepID=A0A5Q0H1X0_SACSY|nr:GAF domain-containing protein [Saccharothrix syringae]QFZ20256.1 GAF domain-containing protein [Saccharothrix syringae]